MLGHVYETTACAETLILLLSTLENPTWHVRPWCVGKNPFCATNVGHPCDYFVLLIHLGITEPGPRMLNPVFHIYARFPKGSGFMLAHPQLSQFQLGAS